MDTWDRKYLQRHAGCHECPAPCTFLYRLQQAKDQAAFDAALRPFLDGLLLDDADAPEGVTAAWQQWTRWRGPWDNRAAALVGAKGQTRLGTTYCAATQAAYEWLGRVLAARALTVGGTGELEPAERLQRESAAAALAKLFWLWTGKSALDDEARQTFERARGQVRQIVAGAPPQELPGCGACPVRCRALPFVAPVLGELQKKVGAKLAMPGALSAQTQRVSLTPIVEATIPVLANRLVPAAEPTLTDDLLYCTVVNTALPPAAEATRTALLDLLRQRPDEQSSAS